MTPYEFMQKPMCVFGGLRRSNYETPIQKQSIHRPTGVRGF